MQSQVRKRWTILRKSAREPKSEVCLYFQWTDLRNRKQTNKRTQLKTKPCLTVCWKWCFRRRNWRTITSTCVALVTRNGMLSVGSSSQDCPKSSTYNSFALSLTGALAFVIHDCHSSKFLISPDWKVMLFLYWSWAVKCRYDRGARVCKSIDEVSLVAEFSGPIARYLYPPWVYESKPDVSGPAYEDLVWLLPLTTAKGSGSLSVR